MSVRAERNLILVVLLVFREQLLLTEVVYSKTCIVPVFLIVLGIPYRYIYAVMSMCVSI
jgi:hypothetical protein